MARRRGFNLLECGIAGVVLAMMMVVCTQFITAMAGQRRALRWRETALREAGNALERLAARPWDSLTQTAHGVQLSPEGRQLPQGEMSVEIAPGADPPEAKRVAVEVRWKPSPEQAPQTVRLTAWRHRKP
jgi:hypothetical protein